MAGLVKREKTKAVRPVEVFGPVDRLFDDWGRVLPFRLSTLLGRDWMPADVIRVDEFREEGALVVRAELPGIDPDKDVEITVRGGVLHIQAEHREEEKHEERGYMRQELRYGSFARTLPLPEGVSESDVIASYKDGILEIRIPVPELKPATKIPIAKS